MRMLKNDLNAQMSKLQYWWAFRSKNGLKGPPVLEFALFFLNHAI